HVLDGSSKVVPQKGAEPLHHGDYEDSDKSLVFAAADGLSTLGGEFPAKLLGNTGFFKLDFSISPHHNLSARLNTSRSYGQNKGTHLFLNNSDFYDRLVFPEYPNPLVNCPLHTTFCAPPDTITAHLTSDVSAFAHTF